MRVAELDPRLVELRVELDDLRQVLDGVLVVGLELVEDPEVVERERVLGLLGDALAELLAGELELGLRGAEALL
jgi:hypothetical protein